MRWRALTLGGALLLLLLAMGRPSEADPVYSTFIGPCATIATGEWHTDPVWGTRNGGRVATMESGCGQWVGVTVYGRTDGLSVHSVDGTKVTWQHAHVQARTSCRIIVGTAPTTNSATCQKQQF